MPDLIFPSSNPWGIPDLSPEPLDGHRPALQAPLVAWGSVARKANPGGTWAFYVDDYRFDGLWRDPDVALKTGAAAFVEPNYSVYEDTPRAAALWSVYRKRWLAAYWQRAGAKVWVDLCMPEAHADLALLGVPSGWQRFATAGWDRRVTDLDTELAWAVERSAGAPFTLLVYGGGAEVRAWCQNRAGVLHCPRATDSKYRPGQGTRAAARREAEAGKTAILSLGPEGMAIEWPEAQKQSGQPEG